MDVSSPSCQLAAMLSARAGHRHGRVLSPSDVSAELTDHCGLSATSAEALAWGEPCRVGALDSDRIAARFGLDSELLRAVLGAASDEVLAETLLVSSARLPERDCVTCQTLAADADEAVERPWGSDELRLLAVEVLFHHARHLTVAGAKAQDLVELDQAVAHLPADAQRRVLSYAQHELGLLRGH